MTKKKILYIITQTHYGGASKYVHDLALSLLKDGQFNISVAVGEGLKEQWMIDLEKTGIEVIRLKHVKRNLSPWHDFMSGFELFNLYKRLKPNLIHLNSSKVGATGSVVAWLYKKLTNNQIKIIYTVHGLVLNEPLTLWRKIYYWLAEWLGAKFKDVLICVSEYDKKSILKKMITKSDKIKIIHNGIDLNKLNFLPNDEALERLHSLSPITQHINHSHIVVGTIAGLYNTKGIDYLIKAVDIVTKELPNKFDKSKIKFVVIGSGPEKKRLKNLVKKYKLQTNIIFTGQIKDAASLLKAFNIFVLPSIKEGLSYTLIEARVAGLPIISTNIGGNPEIITNNITGILIKPASSETLAKELLNLIKYENVRKKLSTETIKNINQFSLENMIKKTIIEY